MMVKDGKETIKAAALHAQAYKQHLFGKKCANVCIFKVLLNASMEPLQ